MKPRVLITYFSLPYPETANVIRHIEFEGIQTPLPGCITQHARILPADLIATMRAAGWQRVTRNGATLIFEP